MMKEESNKRKKEGRMEVKKEQGKKEGTKDG